MHFQTKCKTGYIQNIILRPYVFKPKSLQHNHILACNARYFLLVRYRHMVTFLITTILTFTPLFQIDVSWRAKLAPCWVHSSAKEVQDKKRRDNKIAKIEAQLTELSSRLNQYRLKSEEQIKKAIEKIIKGASDLFQIQLLEDKQTIQRQIGPGKPGPQTRYKKIETISYKLEWGLDPETIRNLTVRDGIFPLITNADIEASEVLKSYKNQPSLEKRMYTTKSILNVAPVFLKKPRRIEAMTVLYFIALMIVSLMERNIRKNMAQEKIERLPILPNGMNTSKPTWNNINYFYKNIHLSLIEKQGKIIQTTLKGITNLHELVLKLLGISPSVYTTIRDQWWLFTKTVEPQSEGAT